METVGVFFGSRSPEHDVSIITGQLIIAGLLAASKYNVVPIYIGKDGIWYSDDALLHLDFFSSKDKEDKLSSYGGWLLNLDELRGKFVIEKSGMFSKTKRIIDIAFPAFHGENGEDGTIQGLFELCNVPYVGCGVAASAVTMDKVITKLLYERFSLPTTQFVYFDRAEWKEQKGALLNKIVTDLKLPVFVKPARLGSSIGIAKAKDLKGLEFAIDVALHYDTKAIIEEAVSDVMDVTCSVIGFNEPRASLLQESLYEGSDLFSYEEKYITDGGAQLGKAEKKFIIPARLPDDTTREIREMAVKVFKLFELSGVSRVDFLYNKTSGQIFVNEVNTLPGTLYHHQWKASGVPVYELLESLVICAKERHQEKSTLMRTFESDILKNIAAGKLSQKLSPSS